MIIVWAACVIGVISAVLCFSQVLDRDQLLDLNRRIRNWQFTLWQMMAAVIVAGLLLRVFTARGPDQAFLSIVILFLGFLTWFVRCWQKEFVFLMGLKDDDFPGRHDKTTWVIVLLAFAPVGVWFFRAYRLAHWPEPVPAIDLEGRAKESGDAATLPA
jgi:hypothetical protein